MGLLISRAALALATASVLAVPARARASSLDLYGFGPRGSAMGLTGTAAVEGMPAVYYNPGALASLEGVTVSVGYQTAPTTLTLNGHDIGARNPRAAEVSLGFGLSTFGRPSAIALGMHVPDTGMYGVRSRPLNAPQFVVIDPRRDREHTMMGYAISPIDKLEIGVGASVLSDTLAKIGIEYGAEQGADMDSQLLPANTFYAGVRAGPWHGVRVGFMHREDDISILSFRTVLHATVAGVDGDVLVRSRTFSYYTPAQYILGVSWDNAAFTATADLLYSQWGGMKDPSGNGGISVVDRVGNLPPSPLAYTGEDPRFHDTFSPHVGGEWRRKGAGSTIALRAGYAFEPTPAPAPSPTRNLVDLDRHVLTAGAGVKLENPPVLTGPLEVDVYGNYSHLVPKTFVRDDPTDPVGAYEAAGNMWCLGFTMTMHFEAKYLRE